MTATAAPARSKQQRLLALERANGIRSRRSQLKRDIKAGKKSVPTLLAAPPEWLLTMKAWELVLAQPKWGRVKVGQAFRVASVSPSKTIGGLSIRQRIALINELRGRERHGT